MEVLLRSGSSVDHSSGGDGGALASLINYYGEIVMRQLLPNNTSMSLINHKFIFPHASQ